MEPINYSVDVQSPFQAVLQGYQAGSAIRNEQLQRQQQEAALQEKQQKTQVIQSLIKNKNATADDYSQAMLLVPELKDQFKQAWETKSVAQQQSNLVDLSQWMAAIQNGQPQIAVNAMAARADAMEAAAGGKTQESEALRTQANVIKEHPEFGAFMMKSLLVAHPDGKNVVDAVAKLGQEDRAAAEAPADLRKKNAEAISAETTAKFAEPKALLDLQEKGWNIEGIKADIDYKKQQSRIAAMNEQIGRESNDLKRQELQLKVAQTQQELTDKANAKAADVESARGSMDNMLNTADRVLNTPKDVIAAAAGPLDSRMPTMQQDVADFEEMLNTLGSQAFVAQIPNIKGTGSLSDAEGKKLQAALQNFNLRQSPEQLISSVREAQRLILKARENLSTRYGGANTVPDRPNVDVPGLPAGFKILGKE